MMTAGREFSTAFERELLWAKRRRFFLWWSRSASILGGLVTVFVGVWLAGTGQRAFGVAGVGWITAVILGGVLGAVFSRTRRCHARQQLLELESRWHGCGELLAAHHLLEHQGRGSRLAPLVLAAADRTTSLAPAPPRAPLGTRSLSASLLAVSVTVVLLCVPKDFLGLPSTRTEKGATTGASVPEPARALGAPETALDPTSLSDLAHLELVTNHQIYRFGDEVFAWITLVHDASGGTDVPLRVVLCASDGLPSPDVGFGEGMRPIDLPLIWSLAAAPAEPLRHRMALKEDLERLQIYKPGLLTLEAFAWPREQGRFPGGLRSNQVTIQLAEGMDRLQVRKPTSTRADRAPKKKSSEKSPGKGKGKSGKEAPKLGAPENLDGGTRRPHAVKPLLTEGPRVEKEVDVFERERGGEARPPNTPKALPETHPARTFLRRGEEAIPSLRLTPAERNMVRRYWDAVRRRG